MIFFVPHSAEVFQQLLPKPPMGMVSKPTLGKLGEQIIIIVILTLIRFRYCNLIWGPLEGHTHKTWTLLLLSWQGQQVKCWHHSWLAVLCLTKVFPSPLLMFSHVFHLSIQPALTVPRQELSFCSNSIFDSVRCLSGLRRTIFSNKNAIRPEALPPINNLKYTA